MKLINSNKLFNFRLLFIIMQLIMQLIMWIIITDSRLMSQYHYLGIYSVWTIATYGWLFYKELTLSDGFQPVVFIALVTIQFLGLNGLSISLDLADGETFYFVRENITQYLDKAMWFLSLEHILILSGYYLVDYIRRRKPLPDIMNLVERTNINYPKLALQLYGVIWFLRIVNLILPLSSATSLLVGLADRGQMVVLTFLAYQMLKKPNKSVTWNYWIITILEILLVLNHGMKEEILLNIVPYLIFLLIGYKSGKIPFSAKFILKLSLIGVVTIYVVFPYVAIFREIANKKHLDWSEVSVTEAISKYNDYILSNGEYSKTATSSYSSDYLLSRAGSLGANAWSIHYAENHSPVYQYFIASISRAIPRFLWPNKPPNVIGNMMYRMASGDKNWERNALNAYYNNEKTVSVTIGFIGGAYFSLGIIGAIFLPFIAGLFIAWYWRKLEPLLSYNIIAIWTAYGLIMMILKDFEALVDGGITFYITGMVMIFLAYYIFPMRNFAPQKLK